MDHINRQQLGEEAEQSALTFLQAKGLKLITQNFTCYSGEIDLIMQDKEDVVFVEVRSRKHTYLGNALESIDRHKMTRLTKAATMFLQKKNWLHKLNSRFDIVAIHPVAGKMQLEWIQNAFTIDKYW